MASTSIRSVLAIPLALALGAGILGGCATQPPPTAFSPPGFWLALVHGFLAPLALLGSLFSDIRIYAFPNSGFFYDLGFLLGLSTWGGGGYMVSRNDENDEYRNDENDEYRNDENDE